MTGGYGQSRLMHWLPVLVCSLDPRTAMPASTTARQPQGRASNVHPLHAAGVLPICTLGRAAPAWQPAPQPPGVGMSGKANGGDGGGGRGGDATHPSK